MIAKWSNKLRRSCYPPTVRLSRQEKWDKMCEEEDAGVRPIHRPREWKEKVRRLAQEQKKNTWHQVSAPLIIDPSAGP